VQKKIVFESLTKPIEGMVSCNNFFPETAKFSHVTPIQTWERQQSSNLLPICCRFNPSRYFLLETAQAGVFNDFGF
jgi:hypothetical protein